VELKHFILDENGQPRVFDLDANRQILSGLKFVFSETGSYVETSTNFPGIFVLVEY
jgi:hypothetical protein